MSFEGISISLADVTSTAGSIKTINESLDARLQDIKTEMNNLTNTWQSDASSTIQDKFNALVPRFEEYKKVITNYVDFLNQTVTNYDAAETAINSNASQFK